MTHINAASGETTQTATVDVKSAWWSKINWTQAVSLAAHLLRLYNAGRRAGVNSCRHRGRDDCADVDCAYVVLERGGRGVCQQGVMAMHKALLVTLLTGALVGCATVPAGPPAPGGTIVTDVQNIARSICKFVPTAETILSLLSTFTGTSPLISQASQIADAICTAVQQTSQNKSLTATRARRAPPTVNGVAIRGRFVR